MRLSDFVLLSEENKKSTLLHEGMLVAKRKQSGNLIFLFQVDAFYVELYGNMATKRVDEYKAFYNTEALHPYLDSIPLDGLL
jgi:hypothetical protein